MIPILILYPFFLSIRSWALDLEETSREQLYRIHVHTRILFELDRLALVSQGMHLEKLSKRVMLTYRETEELRKNSVWSISVGNRYFSILLCLHKYLCVRVMVFALCYDNGINQRQERRKHANSLLCSVCVFDGVFLRCLSHNF